MSTILTYVRPWNNLQFIDLASRIWTESKIQTISEHSSVDQCGLKNLFYKKLAKEKDLGISTLFTEDVIADIILRCRLLRAIPEKKARNMLFAMEVSIRQIIKEVQPKAILSITVDSYILHILYIIATEKNIPFIGLVPTFVNGYFRITSLGEKCKRSAIKKSEVTSVKSMLLRTGYKPKFLSNTSLQIRKRRVKSWIKNLPKPLWFLMMRYLKNDIWNYHFYASQIVSSAYWSLLPRKYQTNLEDNKIDNLLLKKDKPYVFFPLQMSPEATIDYWSQDNKWIDYESRVLSILNEHTKNVHIFIKEHPNVVGIRSSSFYKSLKNFTNCTLIPAEMDSNLVLDVCDGVIICTGSIGFEAALRGKTVYSDNNPFYLNKKYITPLESIRMANIQQPMKHITNDNENEMVEYLLEGFIGGHFINDGTWCKDSSQHIKYNNEMANNIRAYLINTLLY